MYISLDCMYPMSQWTCYEVRALTSSQKVWIYLPLHLRAVSQSSDLMEWSIETMAILFTEFDIEASACMINSKLS